MRMNSGTDILNIWSVFEMGRSAMEDIEVVTCKRQYLFEQVWTEPVTKVAKRYGLSDVGLAKVCRRYHIPLPGRGYWQQVEKGCAPARPALPALEENQWKGTFDRETIIFRVPKATTPGQQLPEAAELNPKIQAESDPANKIIVTAELESPHPYIKLTKAALREARTDERGVLRPRAPCLDMRVSKNAVDRAFRVMDSILKVAVARGYDLNLEKTYYNGEKSNEVVTNVIILGEKLEIGLEEIIERSDHRPTEAEKKKQGKHSWYTPWPRYDFVATGRLVLKIRNIWSAGLRKSWADGKQQRLEECLNDFFATLLKAALEKRADRLESERREAERRALMERQAELERQRREEEERFQGLVKDAKAWRQSNEIRSYVDAVRKATIEKHGTISPDGEIDRWIRWATLRADMLDPLLNQNYEA